MADYMRSLDDDLERDREDYEEVIDEFYDRRGAPASPADDTGGIIPLDHPQTDQELDAHELYDEGIADAANDALPDNSDV